MTPGQRILLLKGLDKGSGPVKKGAEKSAPASLAKQNKKDKPKPKVLKPKAR